MVAVNLRPLGAMNVSPILACGQPEPPPLKMKCPRCHRAKRAIFQAKRKRKYGPPFFTDEPVLVSLVVLNGIGRLNVQIGGFLDGFDIPLPDGPPTHL